jgi:hypothetical protein
MQVKKEDHIGADPNLRRVPPHLHLANRAPLLVDVQHPISTADIGSSAHRFTRLLG